MTQHKWKVVARNGQAIEQNEATAKRLRADLKREIRKQIEALPPEKRERLFRNVRDDRAVVRGDDPERQFEQATAREVGGDATALIVERADGRETRIGSDELAKTGKRASFEDVFAQPALHPDGSRRDVA